MALFVAVIFLADAAVIYNMPDTHGVNSGLASAQSKKKSQKAQQPKQPTPAPAPVLGNHDAVVTTVFWAGESAGDDNSYIANAASAWDEQWEQHYGGVDDPDARSGYLPAAFTPNENPFYFALPYSDITDSSRRRATAKSCPNSNNTSLLNYSWCKNAWIAVQFGSKIVYAQWEDVGPYQSNDFDYVFGTSKPKNRVDVGAGLDISPAVRDYLGVGDVSRTSWRFVAADKVPAGPWKQIVTSSRGDSIN